MKKTLISLLTLAVTVLVMGLTATQSWAVPSFARQFGKPCSACHTMWPRLNNTGREFKLTAYTDVAQDYPRLEGDNLDLLRYSPLSLSVISFPYTKSSGNTASTDIPAEVALFYAGRITPNVGAFVEPVLAPDFNFEFAKVAAYRRLGSNTVGLAAGKMDTGGVDPYNTIRFTAYQTINLPSALDEEHVRGGDPDNPGDFFEFGATDNTGIIANGKFLNNHLYLAAGGFRGHSSVDPWDFYGRAAWEQPLIIKSNVSFLTVGGVVYDGTERYADPTSAVPDATYDSDVSRFGADFDFQMEAGPHIIEAFGLYMQGKDKDLDATAGNDVKFKSYYGAASYIYDRMYTVTVAYDHMKSDEDPSLNKKGPSINVGYNPWLNTKLALEYADFSIDNDHERHLDFLVHLYF